MFLGTVKEFMNDLNIYYIVVGIVFILCLILFVYYQSRMRQRQYLSIRSKKTDEIFGPKEWEQQMSYLAQEHKDVKWMKYNFIVSSYNQDAYKKLNHIRNNISQISADIIELVPSARWLFDNFQMMYREIKKVKTTGTSYKTLPVLCTGEYRGYPRIYVIARKMIDFSNGYLNEENILLMLNAYQKNLSLTDKELWAFPEMLGLGLLECIIEVSENIIEHVNMKDKAEQIVKEHLSIREDYLDITNLLQDIKGTFNENISFHSHVVYLLRNLSAEEEVIQKYITYHLKSEATVVNASKIFKEEGKVESVLESNIRTLIVSLRELNEIDEESIFEKLSDLEHILLKDPAGIYPKMDANSRGAYRGVIEKISQKQDVEERIIGELCLEIAESGREDLNCSHHVGTYILGKGYPILKAKVLGRQAQTKIKAKHNLKGIMYFIFSFLLFAISIFLFFELRLLDTENKINADIVILFVAIPILIEIILVLANNVAMRIVPAQKLPAMDYLKEIPDEARTYIVMPVIISTKEQGSNYIERLHKYYLANRQENLYYALLVDYSDSSEQHTAEDEEIKTELVKHVDELNQKYPFIYKKFSLFIRDRKWNESEICYMGWERKRGKIEELNAILNGEKEENTSFSTLVCSKELLHTFQYVITLDADSNLILNNAARMVGIIDHPLNHAIIDGISGKIIEGCAILQPSVRNHIVDKKSSLFPRVFAGQTGISSYATMVSDLYQDIFGEGTYIGKGIYNVKIFHQILNGAIPENSVLSHDLLESCYVKTAFDGEVSIMDKFPNDILSYVKREHRWIRGDWQLLPWLFKKKKIGIISKWKIIDNLRRSLIPISKLLVIIFNLALMPHYYYLWIPIVFFLDFINLIILLLGTFIYKIRRPKLKLVHRNFRRDIWFMMQRMVIEFVLIPYKAVIAVDAIGRTIYRLLISKKNLLKWKSSEYVESSIKNSIGNYLLHMWCSSVPAIIIIIILLLPEYKMPLIGILLYVTVAVLWSCAFLIAYIISQPEKIREQSQEAREEKEGMLNETARRTWQFFKDFSSQENNWLCPDNYQISHKEKITNKTSPTNIGLQFLSILSARDFGYETLSETVLAVEQLLDTVEKLPKWKGHLFNWYNINTLEVLNPEYISTVDSGNFFGDLIALKNGIQEQKENPIFKEYLDFNIKESDAIPGITLIQLAQSNNEYAKQMIVRIDSLTQRINVLLESAEFEFLYNKKRMLFHIGYHVSSQMPDTGCYDLMASESSLTSFLAIARDEVPVKHWYKLGRPLTIVHGIPAFVSWSGTMFEYLMPNLIMKSYDGSVFAETAKAAVLQQIEYAKHTKRPWGISESQYNGFDLDSNYQYRAFGVPGLRLQPSLTKSFVVAPYATMLALEFAQDEALLNLKKLKDLGAFGKYGYYEAIDFNGPDPVNLLDYCIVKSFMIHHQGMSFVAINNFLHNGIMRNRFHAEPSVKATEILLEEKRQTYFISISKKGYAINIGKIGNKEEIFNMRCVNGVSPQIPVVNYLSNSNYSMLVTSDGDGFSTYNDIMLYRWRADIYANTGNYIYIKDVNEGKVWSTSYHPTKTQPDKYQAIFLPHQSEFKRRDEDITTHTVVSLVMGHNLEVRKIELTNHGKSEKQIELTSYMEVVGDRHIAELSHPAFNKLFIESEFIKEHSIFLSRRRGGSDNKNPYIMHMVKTGVPIMKSVEYENDRLKFIGRNNTLETPDAVMDSITLSNSTGFSNDPIMSLRVNVLLGAEQTVCVAFITGVCDSAEEAIKISDELCLEYRVNDLFEKFRQQSEMELKYLNITKQQLNAFQDIISPIYYPSGYYRGPIESIRRNWKTQSFLWRFGVSGDNPILLLRVSTIEEAGIIRNVLKAYEYLRINKVDVDLIILNEAKYGYLQELTDFLNAMISTLKIYNEDKDRPSLFILYSYQMIPADVDLLFTVAKVVFTDKTDIYFRNVKENVNQITVK